MVCGRRFLCGFIIAIACVPNLVAAATSSEPIKCNVKIESQPLGLALQEFAKQCGIQIIFFSRITDGLQAPAMNARYTITGALEVLLSRSHLTFRVINLKTIEIRP